MTNVVPIRRDALSRLGRGEAIMMRWPAMNGGFVMGFGPDDAREIRARGWIVLNGRRARVAPASLADDDLRIDFEFTDDQIAAAEVAA
jgi:hypothetical protein